MILSAILIHSFAISTGFSGASPLCLYYKGTNAKSQTFHNNWRCFFHCHAELHKNTVKGALPFTVFFYLYPFQALCHKSVTVFFIMGPFFGI